MSDSGFVGEDRHRLVDDLVAAFYRTRDQNRSRLWVESPTIRPVGTLRFRVLYRACTFTP